MRHTIKILIFMFAIVTIITVSGFFTLELLYETSYEIESKLKNIEASILSGNWAESEKTMKQVLNDWASTKKTWSVLIDHQEIDNIDVTLSRMEKLIKTMDTSSALAESSVLIKYVRHIPRKEAPGIENIF